MAVGLGFRVWMLGLSDHNLNGRGRPRCQIANSAPMRESRPDSGLGVKVKETKDPGAEWRNTGSRSNASPGFGFRVLDFGFRVLVFGFRVSGAEFI